MNKAALCIYAYFTIDRSKVLLLLNREIRWNREEKGFKS